MVFVVNLCLNDSNEQSIYDPRQGIKPIVVNMLQDWSYIYFSYNNNIKYEHSIIKYI